MVEYDEEDMKRTERLNQYIIRDEETDEVVGLDPSAPQDVRSDYEAMMKRMNSDIPEDK